MQLGLSSDEFFALTPRQFHLLLDQHHEKVAHQELLAGIIASQVVNTGFRSPSEPTAPADFMPSHRRPKAKRMRMTKQRREAVAQNIRDLFAARKAEREQGKPNA